MTSLGLVNLLGGLTELRQTCDLLDCQFITQGYNSGMARWKMRVGQGLGNGAELLWPLSSHAPSSMCSPPRKLSQALLGMEVELKFRPL